MVVCKNLQVFCTNVPLIKFTNFMIIKFEYVDIGIKFDHKQY